MATYFGATTLAGTTLTTTQIVGIGATSTVFAGMTQRYTYSAITTGNVKKTLRSTFDPKSILIDMAVGAGMSVLSLGINKIQTTAEYQTVKAQIESFKKFCKDGVAKIFKQKAPTPVEIPETPVNSNILTGEQYLEYLKNSQHYTNSKDVMLGKYDNGGPTSYINQATKNGRNYSYFDTGNDYNTIKTQYGYSDSDMFELFNKPFLDDAISQGKTFHFSHNPVNDTGALGQEFAYLQEHGYSWDANSMTMTR